MQHSQQQYPLHQETNHQEVPESHLWSLQDINQILSTITKSPNSQPPSDWAHVLSNMQTYHSAEEAEYLFSSILSTFTKWRNAKKKVGPKKKRVRRRAANITRTFICPSKGCSKAYGSEGALKYHFKQKHPEQQYEAKAAEVQKNLAILHQQQLTQPEQQQQQVASPQAYPPPPTMPLRYPTSPAPYHYQPQEPKPTSMSFATQSYPPPTAQPQAWVFQPTEFSPISKEVGGKRGLENSSHIPPAKRARKFYNHQFSRPTPTAPYQVQQVPLPHLDVPIPDSTSQKTFSFPSM